MHRRGHGRRVDLARLAAVAIGLLAAAGCSARPEVTAPASGPWVGGAETAGPPTATPPPLDTAAPAPTATARDTTTVAETTTTVAPTTVAPETTTTAPPETTTTVPPTTSPPDTVPPDTAPPVTAAPLPTPAEVGANELGDVPILMYHQIVPAPKSVHDRTPEEFRAELERLAAEGYVPITAAEYAAANFSAVPPGHHAVVLTFDDSTTSQFSLTPDGAPAPGTAVAIMLEVAAAHPGFRPVATFYVNRNPFADRGGTRTLPWLVANGFEVGNHTRDHANLSQIDAAAVQDQLASNQAAIQAAVPGLPVVTMALPYGARPSDRAITVTGSSGGVTYLHAAVLYAGAQPAPSPFAADYNPVVVPRIRSQLVSAFEGDYSSEHWLNHLAAHPEQRFTSDGDPARVAFPAGAAPDLAPGHAAAANPY